MRSAIFSLILLGILGGSFFFFTHEAAAPLEEKKEEKIIIKKEEKSTTSILFLGDIMLGRHVETLMGIYGAEYPFLGTKEILNKYDYTIGNFEGVVTKEHIQTPSMGFAFSIREEYLRMLRTVGFDILSLSNNHALDYGEESLHYTKEKCAEQSLVCPGHPLGQGDDHVHIIEAEDLRIGLLFLHTTWNELDMQAVQATLAKLKEESDLQIASIHWGTEYERTHSISQEAIAHELIDSGVDAVVGHHPHVVQDVEIYKNAPIFYSLGNFIFDQYFSDDVQEGIGIAMTIQNDEIEYSIIPFSSKKTHAQPNQEEEKDASELFLRIVKAYPQGVFTVPRQ